jgi:TPR repeat protein
MRRLAVLLLSAASWLAGCKSMERAPSPVASAADPVLPSVEQALARGKALDTVPEPPALPSTAPELVRKRDVACSGGDGAACVDLAWLVVELGLSRAPARLAADALRRGCDRGAQDACGVLGHYSSRGFGVLEDPKKGRELMESACTRRSADACARLGIELIRGERLDWDPERGRKLLDDGCRDGSFRACAALEQALRPNRFSSLALPKDAGAPPASDVVWQRAAEACKAGLLEACLSLEAPELRPLEELLPCSVGWFSRCDLYRENALDSGCKAGSTRACQLAKLYALDRSRACASGLDLGCSPEIASEALARGCEKGALAACDYYVASKDPKAPAEPERVAFACRNGLARACARSALAASEPKALELDALEAICPATLQRGREDFDPVACRRAGEARRKLGTTDDLHRALELFRRGCFAESRRSDDASCVAFASMLDDAAGVAPDPSRAQIVLLNACVHNGGEPASCLALADHFGRFGDPYSAKYWRGVWEGRVGRTPAPRRDRPGPTLECSGQKDGEPCWAAGELAGACVGGACRMGRAPTPVLPPPSPPRRRGPRPCQLSPTPEPGEAWLALWLAVSALALGRRFGRA